MKKFFSVLAAIAVIATAGSVVACATSETEPVIPDTGAAEKDTTIPEETKIEEVKNDDETATTVVETSANTDETTMSDSSKGAESADDTDSESSAEVESATVEVLEDSETEEDGSETVTDEEIEIPQTGDKRKIFPRLSSYQALPLLTVL